MVPTVKQMVFVRTPHTEGRAAVLVSGDGQRWGVIS